MTLIAMKTLFKLSVGAQIARTRFGSGQFEALPGLPGRFGSMTPSIVGYYPGKISSSGPAAGNFVVQLASFETLAHLVLWTVECLARGRFLPGYLVRTVNGSGRQENCLSFGGGALLLGFGMQT